MRLSSYTKIKRGALFKSSRTLHPQPHAFTSAPSPALRRFAAASSPRSCSVEEAQTTGRSSLIPVLRYAKSRRLLSAAKIAHGSLLQNGLLLDDYLCNNLLAAYLSCDAIYHARHLLERMPVRDSVSWNTMISGLVSLGMFRDGFLFFCIMIRHGTIPTQPSFASVLVACAETGNSAHTLQVHSLITRFGFSSFTFVGNSLLKAYVEFGEHEDWRKILNDMHVFDEISVQILLKGCARREIFSFAVDLVKHSRSVGLDVSPYAVTSLLSLCSAHDHADFGFQVHGFAKKVGISSNVSVVNSLITMYSKSRALNGAEDLFELSGSRDIVTWNSLINGYAYNGLGDAGLGLVQRLLSSGIPPNESTFLSFLSCCASITVLKNAKKAHALILKFSRGFEDWTDNVTLAMYCRTRSIEDASASFESAKVKDTLSSNLIMGLYRNFGLYEDSINLFQTVRSKGCEADETMFSGVVSSCSRLGWLDFGCQIHGCVIKSGFDVISHLKNSILELYSQCGRVDDMERIFEESNTVDLFLWNTMLIGYASSDLYDKAVCIWREMLELGIKLNEFSYSALLHACSDAGFLLTGERIHAIVHKMGVKFDVTLMNSLLTMYSNCRRMEKARLVFEEISSPDSVSWNAVVSGLTQNGFPAESIEFYRRMDEEGIEANEMTYSSILSSCSLLSNLKLGLQLHSQAVKRAFDSSLCVSNSLITMYARCGEIDDSSQVFSGTPRPDLIAWNSMINAYAHHGLATEAISVFELMKGSGEKPNNATFAGILSSCSRAGLVSEACHYFSIMDEDYGITPGEEHCAWLVDALCRAGELREAKRFIDSMSVNKSSSLLWRTLLSFCRLNGNAELGKAATEKIVASEPWDSAPYVILSDLYASLGDRVAKDHIRRLMESRGVKKEAGCSWISI